MKETPAVMKESDGENRSMISERRGNENDWAVIEEHMDCNSFKHGQSTSNARSAILAKRRHVGWARSSRVARLR